MQFIYTALLALGALAAAAPTITPVHKRAANLVEQEDWMLSNIVVNQPTKGNSTLSFHFCDINKGLQLETQCKRSVANASSLIDGSWYPCKNSTVRFAYHGNNMEIERAYIDPSLGDPPYDSAIAFGNADTSFVVTSTTSGTKLTQTILNVPITSLIAKA